jgi:hypothetical protein
MEGLCDPAVYLSLGTLRVSPAWGQISNLQQIGKLPQDLFRSLPIQVAGRVERADGDVSVGNPNMRRTERRALRKRHQEFMGVTGRRRARSQRSALRCRREPSIIFRSRTRAIRPAPSGGFLLIGRRNHGAQIAKLRAHRDFGPASQEKLVRSGRVRTSVAFLQSRAKQ